MLEVVEKLATSKILRDEARLGYAEHYWIALANMSEAEDEVLAESQELAEAIREERKKWEEDPQYWVDFLALMHLVAEATRLYPEPPFHVVSSPDIYEQTKMAFAEYPSVEVHEATRPEMWPCGGNNASH